MIDLLPTLSPTPPTAAVPTVASGAATATAGDFGQALGAFLDTQVVPADPSSVLPPTTLRQGPAEDGKDLPVEAAKDDDTVDPVVPPTWFPIPAPFVTGVPLQSELDDSVVAGKPATPAPPVGIVAPVLARPSTARSATTLDAVVPSPHDSSFDGPAQSPALAQPPAPSRFTPAAPTARARSDRGDPPVPTDVAARPTVATPIVVPSSVEALTDANPPAALIDRAVAATVASPPAGLSTNPVPSTPARPAPVSATPASPAPVAAAVTDPVAQAITVSTLPQPAGRVFATALAVAGSWRDRAPRDPQIDANALSGVTTPIDLRERAIVHATTDSAHAALDLTQDSGLQRMIDRIELLRDDMDSRDTRVRLMPDALGSIDVAVRQEGDRVHVRFTADQDATRALIVDAQPRLTELAAARGIRIGDTSVAADTAGGGATPQPRPAPTFTRTRSAALREDAESDTDHRLA